MRLAGFDGGAKTPHESAGCRRAIRFVMISDACADGKSGRRSPRAFAVQCAARHCRPFLLRACHVADDPRGNRLRARQAHRRAERREARRRNRLAQPLAAPAGVRAAAAGNHPEEHPDDRTDGGRQDGNRAPPGAPRRRPVHQGRGDQVHRGGLCRPRRRHDHSRSRGSGDQADARSGIAEGARPRGRCGGGARPRRAAAAPARGEFPRHAADRLGHAPEIPQDAARGPARRQGDRGRGVAAAGANGDHGASGHGGSDEPAPGDVPADGRRAAQAAQDDRRATR